MPIKSNGTKFTNDMYVTVYELARDGMADTQIAKTLGVSHLTLRRWRRTNKHLADALDRGRRRRDPGDMYTFADYVYDHLSPELRDIWNQIQACEAANNGAEMIRIMLANHGTRTRQHLFLYALTQSCFNVSQSMKKIGVSRKHYQNWCANDPDFAALVEEIHWHKENFFESALIGRVMAGDTQAIIHVAKSKLKGRGYNDKIEVEYTGSINHTHTIDITTLDLDVDTRRAVLDAVRKQRDLATRAPIQVTGQVVGE